MEDIKFPPTDEQIASDWPRCRDACHVEFDKCQSFEGRGIIIGFYHAMMYKVRTGLLSNENITDSDLKNFDEILDKDYCLFLVKESSRDGNVDPEILEMVTAREVMSGRMSKDHELRTLAVAGAMVGVGKLAQATIEKDADQHGERSKVGLLGRLFRRS